jgi:hypothetical protein
MMRPTPAEVIAGVRRILRDVVEPEVGSEYARTRLREVRAVLAQVDWDDAALQVRRGRDTLQELIAECHDWMSGVAGGEAAFSHLLPRLVPVDRAAPETLAELNAAYAADATLLAEVSGALAGWTRENPDDEAAQDLRRRLAARLAC